MNKNHQPAWDSWRKGPCMVKLSVWGCSLPSGGNTRTACFVGRCCSELSRRPCRSINDSLREAWPSSSPLLAYPRKKNVRAGLSQPGSTRAITRLPPEVQNRPPIRGPLNQHVRSQQSQALCRESLPKVTNQSQRFGVGLGLGTSSFDAVLKALRSRGSLWD